jgi:hypothetical protein
MRYLRQNTATIVTVGPFYDATNGVAIEGSLTITNEKISMVVDANDGSAPTLVLDNVTGATSGTDNDLNYIANCDAGLMQLELTAANTNYVGRALLTVTDAANHVPVFHEFTILPGAVYDSLIAGTDKLAVDAQEISSDSTAADNLELMYDGTGYAGGTTKLDVNTATIAAGAITATAIATGAIDADAVAADAVAEIQSGLSTFDPSTDVVAHVTLVDTTTSNTDMVAAAPTTAAVADAVWDEAATGHTDAGKAGAQVWTDIDAILVDTDVIGAAGAGLTEAGGTGDQFTALPWNAAWDEEVQSEATDALNAYDPPTNAEMVARTLVAASYFDPATDAVANVTLVDTTTTNTDMVDVSGLSTFDPATDAVEVDGIDAATANTIADHTLRRALGTAEASADGDALSFRSLIGAAAKLVNKIGIVGSTLTVYKADDTAALGTQALTTDATAEPITGADTA